MTPAPVASAHLAQHLLLTKSFMVLYPWYELQEEEVKSRPPRRFWKRTYTYSFQTAAGQSLGVG